MYQNMIKSIGLLLIWITHIIQIVGLILCAKVFKFSVSFKISGIQLQIADPM